MALLRYQLFTSYLIAFLAIWAALLANEELIAEKLTFVPVAITRLCLAYAPIVLLAGLAIYALSSIGHSMISFKDCPEAAKEIEMQVKEAKIELKNKGIVGF